MEGEKSKTDTSRKRAMRALRVSKLTLTYLALILLSLRTFLGIPRRTMSMIQATRAQMGARPERKDACDKPGR